MSFDFNSIWLTIFMLSALVVVHEFGHFIMARAFGVKVHEFSIGFGPILSKFDWKGIQYTIRWFLLGGFVKIAGLDIALEGEGESEKSQEKWRTFQDISLWQKIVVIAAGPIFNLLLALVIIFCTAAFIGVPNDLRNDQPIIEQASPGTPAFEAGIRPGDEVLNINGLSVQKWRDIPAIISKNGGKTLSIKIKRQDQILLKKITPMFDPVNKRHIIGISAVLDYKTLPIKEATKITFTYPWTYTVGIVKTFQLMFSGKLKGGLMGPIGMVAVVEQNTRLHPYNTFALAFSISMFLCLFNLLPLPLPLLDGGWIVILLIERLLRREFSAEQKAAAQMVGLAAFLVLGVIIAYGDILTSFKRFFLGG